MSAKPPEPLRVAIERIDKRTERIESALFVGNGAPPVLSRLSILEERTQVVERSTHSAPVWTGIGGAIGAVIVTVLAYFGIRDQ